MADEQPTERRKVVRNYTATRRFPQLIGKTHDGKQIPGGPYTYTQIFGGGAVLALLWQTMPMWSSGASLMSWAFAFMGTFAVVFFLGKLPLSGRNPLSFVEGLWSATIRRVPQSVAGLTPKRPRVRAVLCPVVIQTELSPSPATPSSREKRATTPRSPRPATRSAEKKPVSTKRSTSDPVKVVEHNSRRRPEPAEQQTHPARERARTRPQEANAPQAAKSSVQSLLEMAQKGA